MPFKHSLLLIIVTLIVVNIIAIQEHRIIPMSPHNYGVCLQGHVYGGGSTSSFCIRVDLATQFTWMHKKDFHVPANSEKTIKEHITMLTADNITYIGREVELVFGWNSPSEIDMTLPDLHVYVFDEPEPHISTRTSIGLAANYTGEEFSFVHQYYRKGMIDELSFSIVGRGTKQGGVIHLGGIPQEATLNRQHTEIKIIGRTHYWDFLLPQVKVERDGNTFTYESTEENDYAFLDSVRRYIYAPKEFIDFLVNEVYKEEYAQEICGYEMEEHYKDRKMTCPNNEEIINRLGNITFHIQDYDYKVPIKFFWNCKGDKCVSSIIQNHVKGNWRICMNFFYDSALFVMSNQTIQLYLEDEVTVEYNPLSSEYYSIKISCLVLITIGSFIGIGLLSMYLFKKVL